jgi:hypothetical protein
LWLLLAQQAVSKVGSAGKFGNAEAVGVALAIHSHWLSQLVSRNRPPLSSPGSGPNNAPSLAP